jgi:sporulation protein YlmC with PRC-barrel domain
MVEKEYPKETLVIEPIHPKEAYMNNGIKIGSVKNVFINLENKEIEGVYIINEKFERFFSREEILDILKNKVILKTNLLEIDLNFLT